MSCACSYAPCEHEDADVAERAERERAVKQAQAEVVAAAREVRFKTKRLRVALAALDAAIQERDR